ncbi:hypothetical protein SDC9_158729 [bioreactor metagenome]|uniref:Uncharacterized protein n=1 Tax=bioreactor metagenome TaxID=1076179 RepID=A0A645FAM6_9ZZZZ
MFGLRQEIRRHRLRIGAVVGDHHDLRRPRHHVDGDLSVDQLLGRGDISVAGTDDLLHLADGRRPVRQCGNPVDAAQPVNLRDPGDAHRVQHRRMHVAVPSRRRDRDDFLHSRRTRDPGGVNHRRNQRRRAARDIDADPFHRGELFAEYHSGSRVECPVGRLALFGKPLDVCECESYGFFGCRVDFLCRVLEFFFCDSEL